MHSVLPTVDVPDLLPEVAGPDEDLLCAKVFRSRMTFEYIVESYDLFVSEGLQECMDARPLAIPGGDSMAYIRIAYASMRSPTYLNDYNIETSLTKEIASLERRDYMLKIPIQVEIRNGDTRKLSKVGTLFELPLMVYSKYCCDHNNKQSEIDNPTNPGCYFILDGGIKFMPLYEKVRQNQLIVGSSKNGMPFAYQLSETPYSTSNTACKYYIDASGNKLLGVTLNKSEYSVYEDTTDEADKEKDLDDFLGASAIKTTNKPKEPVNVLSVIYTILFCANTEADLGFLSTPSVTHSSVIDYVIDMLMKVIPGELYMSCSAKLYSTIQEFKSTTHEDIINSVITSLEVVPKGEAGAKTKANKRVRNDAEIRYRVEAYFKVKLLPNILQFEGKVNTIVMLMSYLLQRIVDPLQRETDRDHWGHKGLSRARELLTDSFGKKLEKFFRAVETSKQYATATTPDSLLNLLCKSEKLDYNITEELLKDFKPSVQAEFSFKKAGKSTDPIAMDIIPNNANDLRAVLGKTRTNVNKNIPSFGPRSAHPSSYPGICPLKLTENALIGITKFSGLLTVISNKTSARKLVAKLLERHYLEDRGYIRIVSKNYQDGKRTVPVLVNGMFIGYTNADTGYKNMTMYKRYGRIDRQCCIVKTIRGTIEIYCDSRRVLVPVVGCDESGTLRIYSTGEDWKQMSYNELVRRGYIEYYDPYESENPNIVLAQTFASFHNYKAELLYREAQLAGVIARLLQVEDSDTKVNLSIIRTNLEAEITSMRQGKYSHAPLHPNGAYSVGAANIPFGNNEMACRSGFASKHEEQKMSRNMGDQFAHADGFIAAYNTRTLVDSSMNNITKTNQLVAGQTVIIGFLARADNQEDACIISAGAVEKGFRFNTITVVRETLESGEEFGRYNKGIDPSKQKYILENGLPIVGAYYGEGDCVLGKYAQQEIKGKPGEYITADKSYYLAKDEIGVVTEVVTYKSKQVKSKSSTTTVSIRLCKYNTLEVGGKITTRHAQKHILARIVPTVDMPFNDRGQSIDMLMSPLCLPTRMTFGTTGEPFYGRAAGISGEVFDMASHKEHDFERVSKILTRYGYQYDGEQRYTNGITGEPLQLTTFTGPSNVSMLIHVAIKKAQARAGLGKKHNVTNQVVSKKFGKCEDKGQKFSVPERDKGLQYGSSFLISERMNTSCDGVEMVVCKQCSSWASFNSKLGRFECAVCGLSDLNKLPEEQFGKYIIPQTTLYLQAGLLSIGIDLSFKFTDKEEYVGSDK